MSEFRSIARDSGMCAFVDSVVGYPTQMDARLTVGAVGHPWESSQVYKTGKHSNTKEKRKSLAALT